MCLETYELPILPIISWRPANPPTPILSTQTRGKMAFPCSTFKTRALWVLLEDPGMCGPAKQGAHLRIPLVPHPQNFVVGLGWSPIIWLWQASPGDSNACVTWTHSLRNTPVKPSYSSSVTWTFKYPAFPLYKTWIFMIISSEHHSISSLSRQTCHQGNHQHSRHNQLWSSSDLAITPNLKGGKKKESSTVCSSHSEVSNTFYFADHQFAASEDRHGYQSLPNVQLVSVLLQPLGPTHWS